MFLKINKYSRKKWIWLGKVGGLQAIKIAKIKTDQDVLDQYIHRGDDQNPCHM